MNEKIRRAKQALTRKQVKLAEQLAALDPDSDEHWNLLETIGESQPGGVQVWILALEDELREQRANA